MGHDERGHGEGTVGGFEAAEWADVEFKSTVEPFNDLFEWPELSGGFVEVLEAGDLFESDLMLFVAFIVKEHDSCGVGRVGVGDESKFLVGVCGADGFVHGNGGGQSFAVIRDEIGCDGVFLGRCEQKDKGGLAGNFDIGFIPGGLIVYRAFEAHVELVAMIGCGFGVVEDGLVGDVDVEHDAHDVGGFAGADGEGDQKREDKS